MRFRPVGCQVRVGGGLDIGADLGDAPGAMKRIGVMTSGGDSPGMNAAVRAVVRTAAHLEVDVFGIRAGYQGLVSDDLVPLGPRDVSGIINRGGTVLRTARCKAFYEEAGRARAAETLRQHGIEGLVVIGGDGSYRGGGKLATEHGIKMIGVPGTIDNDIGGTDYTIGYDTALNVALDAVDRIRDTAESHDRLFFVEVMGRHSGYLALETAIAGGAEDVLVPEEPTNIERLIERLEQRSSTGRTSSAIVIVAEGDDGGGAMDIAKQVEGHAKYAGGTRTVVIGHLQRGGRPTAFDRVLASRLGVRAAEALIDGESNQMVGVSNNRMVLRPLREAWEMRNQFDFSELRVARILST